MLRSSCAFIAMPKSPTADSPRSGRASPIWLTPVARSRARGSRALLPSRCARTRPACRTDRLLTRAAALRAAHTGQIVPPSTRQARCRAAEVLEVFGPARPARQSLSVGQPGVTSAAVPPGLGSLKGSDAAAVAPGKLSHRAARLRAPPGWQRVRQSSHRAPPSKPPSMGEGDLWGDLQSGGPGNWLTASAAVKTTHPPSPSP